MDLQFLAVLVIVALAALYAGWRFLRQFFRADDEAAACAKCPAAQPDFFSATDGEAPAPSSDGPPSDEPRP
jgi:hypothetical protein